jgi:hypothetical protein
MRSSRYLIALAALAGTLGLAMPAHASLPYARSGADTHD